MVALGQSREEACALLEISAGHLSHVLGGTRGVGLVLANKIKAAYAERGHDVPTESWSVDASAAEQLLIRETVERIPRPAHAAVATASSVAA